MDSFYFTSTVFSSIGQITVLYPKSVELKSPHLYGLFGVCISSKGSAPFSRTALVINLNAY